MVRADGRVGLFRYISMYCDVLEAFMYQVDNVSCYISSSYVSY